MGWLQRRREHKTNQDVRAAGVLLAATLWKIASDTRGLARELEPDYVVAHYRLLRYADELMDVAKLLRDRVNTGLDGDREHVARAAQSVLEYSKDLRAFTEDVSDSLCRTADDISEWGWKGRLWDLAHRLNRV